MIRRENYIGELDPDFKIKLHFCVNPQRSARFRSAIIGEKSCDFIGYLLCVVEPCLLQKELLMYEMLAR